MRNFSSKLSKFQVFQFLRKIKRNSFHVPNLTLFCKSHIFPVIYDIYTLWKKYNLFKNNLESDHENCSFSPLFFVTFLRPLRLMSEIPSKFTESVWIFLCDLPMYKVFTWGHFLQIKQENKQKKIDEIQKKSLFSILVERGSNSLYWLKNILSTA